jgi:hypothetical protein
VFDNSFTEPEKPQRKLCPTRPDNAGSLVQYNYALQYRDSNVSIKASENRVPKEALQQTKISKGMAEVFKMKRNQSSVTFA